MKRRFIKMHSCGNDFIVLDGIRETVDLTKEMLQKLARRHTGIGFDQCLVVEKSRTPGTDFFYRIFNADGQEVGQCANGVRCLGRFLMYSGLTEKRKLTVQTRTTTMQLALHDDGQVVAILPPPKLDPVEIPFSVERYSSLYALPLLGLEVSAVDLHALNVGNPHAVIKVSSLESLSVDIVGKAVSEHTWFTEQTNVGFMVLLDAEHINLRVYERGCGETLSCGSGAVAAAVVSRLYYQGAETIRVRLPGGELTVQWPQKDGPIFLWGPTCLVYEGTLIEHA